MIANSGIILDPLQAGERSNGEGKAVKNRILLTLPDHLYRQVRTHLEFLELPHHLVLHEPNRKLEFAYFPNSGMISLVVVTKNEKTLEVGLVGKEGMTATAAAAGIPSSPLREIVQIAGQGFRLPVEVVQTVLTADPEFRMILMRYAAVQGMHVAQLAACNRLHSVEQRLARWLLMTQDRVDSGLVPITHDFLATMLGTDRPSVGIAASSLQKKEAIEYRWGSVKVLDRKALEALSCECYAAIQQFNASPLYPAERQPLMNPPDTPQAIPQPGLTAT
jgi:CRP-like cAMP-binding protein